MNRFVVGSGWHEAPRSGTREFFPIWWNNVRKHTKNRVIIIADSGHQIPDDHGNDNVSLIHLDGDCGHVGDLLNGTKKHRFPGGPALILALAALAYMDESDLIYHESDCLVFGDCYKRLYDEIGDGAVCFGRSNVMPCENSLFLLKHWYIPRFLETYAGSPAEHTSDQLCEVKFARWAQTNSARWKYHSIRGGRDRPIPYDDKEYYLQKITPQELATLKERGML